MPTRAERLAAIELPRIPWEAHAGELRRSWKPGQHVSLFAPTDSGKTHLVLVGLAPLWPEQYPWLAIDAKGDDPLLSSFGERIKKMPARFMRERVHDSQRFRLVLRRGVENVAANRAVSISALQQARDEKGWVIHLNEVRALADARPPCLNMTPYLEDLWLRGRPHVTIISETQRPAFVPGSMYDQPTHVYIGQVLDRRAQDRLHEIGGHTDAIIAGIMALREHEFVYVNRKSRLVAIVKAPAK